ncbi:DUF1684 domain-containing protein [Halobium salinum]|uniref:DUF1684 domain-containing protein n=1 Tax=Halobium salinum TaxID=1364940 RepID=A0ABD5P9H6_9EURY|nr:DUF1684 domain-containing protein [Halobium salinum]
MSDEQTDAGPDAVSDAEFDADAWAARLRENRAEKDAFFGDHPQSPIPPEEREAFDGLDYFAPDAESRVTATATVHDEPDPVEMATTASNPVRYLRVATFEFEVGGETHSLCAYKQDPAEDTLFVPFRDATSGEETYEHGRYMEFEPTRDLEAGDEVVLDFNLAYTPFCAYSETFSCPIPPEENELAVPVRAGERHTA